MVADLLEAISHPPSAGAVTTAIVMVQTFMGLIGFWAAGTEVKSIIRHSTKKQAFKTAWSVLIHGQLPEQTPDIVPPAEHQSPRTEDSGTGNTPDGND